MSVALSGDGNTAIVGGPNDNPGAGNNSGVGASWVFTQSGGVWSQQGIKLVGTGAVRSAQQGISVALSGDGNTAIVGGPGDNSRAGAAWVFTRSGGVWTQQGSKLVGTGAVGNAQQGFSVALSGDGNTAIVGGPGDNSRAGSAWVFTRSGGVWTQQGSKLVGTGGVGAAQGWSVALSDDGNTAVVGGPGDNSHVGATWVFIRSGGVWSQQGSKLIGTGAVGNAQQGVSVALSGDGNTAIVGGPNDNPSAGNHSGVGASWVFTQSGGVWSQQGIKLVGIGAIGNAQQGISVALSGDGNTAIVGGYGDNSNAGATWVFTQSGDAWTQQGSKLVDTGAVGAAFQGSSVALSDDGNTAIVGGYGDNSNAGAAWVFGAESQTATSASNTATAAFRSSALVVTPSTNIVASGPQGGPFSPSTFNYNLTSSKGSTAYSITNVPSWLTASSTSGTATRLAKTITFSINSSANSLKSGTYIGNINFNRTTRTATLTVNPAQYTVAVSASPNAGGIVGGGGTFAGGSSVTVTATANSGYNFVNWTRNGSQVTTSPSYTFTINSNVTLVANFALTLQAPTVSSANFSTQTALGAVVGQVSATNSPTSFAITSGNGNNYFTINSSGVISTSATIAAPAGTYSLQVTAANSVGTSAPATIGITLTPPLGSSTPSFVQSVISTTNIPGVEGNAGNNFKYILPNSVRAGNALLVAATWPHGVTPTISDNVNGAWPAAIVTVDGGVGNYVSGFFLKTNVAAGVTTIQAAFGSNQIPFQWNIFEINNVVGANGSTGTANVTGPNLATGSFTPGNNNAGGGNLVVSYFPLSAAASSNPTSWVKGSGHTLYEADILWIDNQGFPHATQYALQTTQAAINPSVTATGDTADTYNCVAIALQVGSAGSPKPSSGIHIDKIIHFSMTANATTALNMQTPFGGNLRVLAADTGGQAYNSVTDSDRVTWSVTGGIANANNANAYIFYRQNAPANDGATLTLNMPAGGLGAANSWRIFDISNAAASSFDTSVFGAGQNFNGVGSVNDWPSITPGVSSGLTIALAGLGQGPGLSVSAPSGAIFDMIAYANEIDADLYENADLLGHYYFSSNATQNWGWTFTNQGSNSSIGSVAATFH